MEIDQKGQSSEPKQELATGDDLNASRQVEEEDTATYIFGRDRIRNKAGEVQVLRAFPVSSKDQVPRSVKPRQGRTMSIQTDWPSQTIGLKDYIYPIPDPQPNDTVVQPIVSTVNEEEGVNLISENSGEEVSVLRQSDRPISADNSPQASPKPMESDRSQIGSETAKVGSTEPQVGSDEPQVGNTVPQIGSETAEVGSTEPQIGSETAEVGSTEPQVGSDEESVLSRYDLRSRQASSVVSEKSEDSYQPDADEEVKEEVVVKKRERRSSAKKIKKEPSNELQDFPLAANDQLKVDIELEPYTKGTRVFANWGEVCYPAYVLNNNQFGRCEVIFVEGGEKRHSPFDGIVPLAMLEVGDWVTMAIAGSELVKQVQIVSAPSKASSGEWVESEFEVNDNTQIVKCNWTQLLINKERKKAFLKRLQKMESSIIVDVGAPHSRRSSRLSSKTPKRGSINSASKQSPPKKRMRK